MNKILINGENLSINDVINVCLNNFKVEISKSSKEKIIKSRAKVNEILNKNKTVYGINTGFGDLANKKVEDLKMLQENLIISHSVGVGEAFSKEIVRAIIMLRANALAKGFSGVRIELVEKLLELLNKDVYSYIPAQGSVGASGDLAPLSHLALCLIGKGECISSGERIPSLNVFKEKNILPITLEAKEGLGLINGTQMMGAISVLVVSRAKNLIKNAIISAGISLEALRGTDKAFDEKVHATRPHLGQIKVAELLRSILKGSKNISSHVDCKKVQDAYSLRCIPQIIGPVLDTLNFVTKIVETEINSATDNPLVFENEIISAGNFHGEYLALAMDFLKIAIAEIGSHSERLTERLINPHLSGLPAFLAKDSGLNSGLMIAQYTAAALVSENKTLAHPASVDSIPTSANQEDHVSMGSISARHALMVLENVEKIVAINLLCACQGIDFISEKPSPLVQKVHSFVREKISFMDKDRILYLDIEKSLKIVKTGIIADLISID